MSDEASQVQVRSGRRPGPGWITVARGLHRTGLPGLVGDLLAWQTTLRPAAAFTHLTAAAVRGWWLPPLPEGLPVWVVQAAAQHGSVRGDLVVIRRRGAPEGETVSGLRLAPAAETLVTCARDLGLLDLILLCESALHAADVTLDELTRIAAQHRRGAPLLRTAIPYLDGRAESPWEVLLRVLHVVCGIAVEPQHDLFDAAGRFVARGDLWLVGTTMFHEYDGGDHLERPQQRRDLKRARRIVAIDHRRRGYTSQDVLTQGVSILRDADATLGRTHEPRRIRRWHELLRGSLFSPSGGTAFRARLRIPDPASPAGGSAA